MNDKKVEEFMASMNSYDGFSDVNYPAVRLWDMNLDEKEESDFSFTCIYNVANQTIPARMETVEDFYILMDRLKANFSELNSDDFPECTKGHVDFRSRLVGFVACAQFNHIWSILPIVELTGPDAESIVIAMALVS